MSRKDTLDESDVQTDNDDEPDDDDIVDDDEPGANFEDNSDDEQEIDNIDEYDIDDTNDFRSILQKIRTISKAVTVTQKRFLSFQYHCHAAKLKPLHPIRNHAIGGALHSICWSVHYISSGLLICGLAQRQSFESFE